MSASAPSISRSARENLILGIVAGRRMIELYQRFGHTFYFAAIEELLDRNRKAVASIISSMPEEPAYFEDWVDDDGQGVGPWKIACTMTKRGERLRFDFSGTDPQSPSSINFFLSVAMLVRFFPFSGSRLISL